MFPTFFTIVFFCSFVLDLQKVGVSANNVEDSTCGQLQSGKVSVLAAGLLLDRFLLLTSDWHLYELPLESFHYLKQSSPLLSSSTISQLPSFKLLINQAPTSFSARYPKAVESLKEAGFFTNDVTLLYGFTLSVYKATLKHEYLVFLYQVPFLEDDTSTTNKYCILAVDVHKYHSALPNSQKEEHSPLCNDDLGALMPISMPPREELYPASQYMRTDDEDLPEGTFRYCGAENGEALLFYSSSKLKSNKRRKSRFEGVDDEETQKKLEVEKSILSFDDVDAVAAYRMHLERTGGFGAERLKSRTSRCSNLTTSGHRQPSSGFQLSSGSGQDVVVIFDSGGYVNVMEDRRVHRNFRKVSVREFIGCYEEIPFRFTFSKKVLVIGGTVFALTQLTICGLVVYFFSGSKNDQDFKIDKRKKRKSKKKSRKSRKSKSLISSMSKSGRSLSFKSTSRKSDRSLGVSSKKSKSSIGSRMSRNSLQLPSQSSNFRKVSSKNPTSRNSFSNFNFTENAGT